MKIKFFNVLLSLLFINPVYFVYSVQSDHASSNNGNYKTPLSREEKKELLERKNSYPDITPGSEQSPEQILQNKTKNKFKVLYLLMKENTLQEPLSGR